MSLNLSIFGVPFPSGTSLNPASFGATNWWATRKSYTSQSGLIILPDNIGTFNLSSSTIAKTPSVQTGVKNIKTLTFDGVSNILQTGVMTLPQPVFLISVIKILSGNTGTPAIFDGLSSTNMLFDLYPNLTTFRMFAGDTLNTPNNVTGDLVIFSHYYSGGSSRLWINGVSQITTGNTTNASPNGLTIGGRGGNTNFSKIDYYESILFKTNITASTHNTIGSALSNIYNTTWTTVQ